VRDCPKAGPMTAAADALDRCTPKGMQASWQGPSPLKLARLKWKRAVFADPESHRNTGPEGRDADNPFTVPTKPARACGRFGQESHRAGN